MAVSDNSPKLQSAELAKLDSQAPFAAIDIKCSPETFQTLIPAKPYCTNDPSEGLMIRSAAIAIKHRLIQFNSPWLIRWILHDIDHSHARFAHRDGSLPSPNVIMINKANGHAHSAFLLQSPVFIGPNTRQKPLRYLLAIEQGTTRRLDADTAYRGLIAKNPLHKHWDVEWRRALPYSLDELAGWLYASDMAPVRSVPSNTIASRNCEIFDEVGFWARRNVLKWKNAGASQHAFHEEVFRRVALTNQMFNPPLSLSEVRGISRSISKWCWAKFDNRKFSAIQADRGRRGAAKRWKDHPAAERLRPWEAEGISRSTYYKRRTCTQRKPVA